MHKQQYRNDIVIILLCLVGLGVVIFLLVGRYKDIRSWQMFMDEYAYVATTVHVPQTYDISNDSMQGPIIQDILASSLTGNNKHIRQYQEQVRSNLALLAKEFSGARAALGTIQTAQDWYTLGTIDMLDAWHISGEQDVATVEKRYDLARKSSDTFATAARLADTTLLADKIDHNTTILAYVLDIIGSELLLARFRDMLTQLSTLDYGLEVLQTLLVEVQSLLIVWEPIDPILITCKEHLGTYLPGAEQDIALSRTIIAEYYTSLVMLFPRCMRDADICIPTTKELYRSMQTTMDAVTEDMRSYSATLYDLDELLLQGYDGPLISFCLSFETLQSGEHISLSEQLANLAAPTSLHIPSPQGSGMNLTGSHIPLEQERETYLLDEIKKNQQKRLDEKQVLEEDDTYSPHQLLEKMFRSFDGNSEGFYRE